MLSSYDSITAINDSNDNQTMEQKQLALSAVMIVAVGLIGTNFVTGLEMTGQEKFDALSNPNVIYGHITLVHSDPDGNVLSYIQTDNAVALIGTDCMAEKTFGDFGEGTNCTQADTEDKFDRIALFNGQSFPVTMNATGYDGQVIGNGPGLLDVVLTQTNLDIDDGVVTVNANATIGTGTKIDIKFTFDSTADGQDVDGAALVSENDDAILAGQVFPSVTLNTSDTLAITWTITVG